MPVYEYFCRDCGCEMVETRRDEDNRNARCPGCGSYNTERILSSQARRPEKKVPCSVNRGG